MCYKKPAPRCSTHARQALASAHKELVTADKQLRKAQVEFELKRDAASEAKLRESEAVFKRAEKDALKAKAAYDKAADEKKAAYKKFKEAQKDYALTPEGIEKVRDSGDGEKADRLAAERKRRIALANVVEVDEVQPVANKTEVSARVKAVFDTPLDEAAWREVKRNGSPEELRQVVNISTEKHDLEVRKEVSESIMYIAESKKQKDASVITACIGAKAMQPEDAHKLFVNMRDDARQAKYGRKANPWVALEQPGVLEAFKARGDAESDTKVDGRIVSRNQFGTTLASEIATYEYELAVAPQIDSLRQAGGREWTGGDKHRVYLDFDEAVNVAGGSVETGYKDEVKKLMVDGRELEVPKKFTGRGIFFDVKAGRWELTGNDEIDKALSPSLENLSQRKAN